jgi:hypothetical protein
VFKFLPYPEEQHGKKNILKDCSCGGGYKSTGEYFMDDNFIPIKNGALVMNSEYTKIGAVDIEAYCPAADIGVKWDKDWPYGWGCPYGALKPQKKCKFDKNDFPWGKPCYHPAYALRVAQTAAFVSIVIVQWADLLICKTRLLSIADQGMQNTVMLFGLCSETLLCMALCYLPFMNVAFGTAPIHPVHWFPSMPYTCMIFLYDETRKYLLRREKAILGPQGKMGFVERYTYY